MRTSRQRPGSRSRQPGGYGLASCPGLPGRIPAAAGWGHDRQWLRHEIFYFTKVAAVKKYSEKSIVVVWKLLVWNMHMFMKLEIRYRTVKCSSKDPATGIALHFVLKHFLS